MMGDVTLSVRNLAQKLNIESLDCTSFLTGGAMKTYALIGIILIVIGIFAFAYQGFTFTTREKVVDLGPIHMTAEKTRTLPLPPIVGGISLVGGIVLLVVGKKKS
jgi:hypothetical protein